MAPEHRSGGGKKDPGAPVCWRAWPPMWSYERIAYNVKCEDGKRDPAQAINWHYERSERAGGDREIATAGRFFRPTEHQGDTGVERNPDKHTDAKGTDQRVC